jgi:hypothetical protein
VRPPSSREPARAGSRRSSPPRPRRGRRSRGGLALRGRPVTRLIVDQRSGVDASLGEVVRS